MQLNLFEFFCKRDLIFFLFGLLVSNVFLLFIRHKSSNKSDLSSSETDININESDLSETSSSETSSSAVEETEINEDDVIETIIEE